MHNCIESLFELNVVSRILGAKEDQIHHLCRLLGIVPEQRDGEPWLCRDSIQTLYNFLYPPYVPPEDARV